MIPRKLHYIWYGGSELPIDIKKMLATWKRCMPDWEIIQWDESNAMFMDNPFFRQAYEAKKWAFAADYARLQIVYRHGGVYLDTDVKVFQSLEPYLSHRFFTSVEYYPEVIAADAITSDGDAVGGQGVRGCGLLSALFGAEPLHPYVGDLLNYYENRPFIIDGHYNDVIIIPDVMAIVAERYGFKYFNRLQELAEGMVIYPSDVFVGNPVDYRADRSVAVHYAFNSWVDKGWKRKVVEYGRRLLRYFSLKCNCIC